MPRPLRWFDAITINIYFTGLTTVSQTLTPLVIPLLVQQFVGVDQQGGYYGQIRLWSLMTALVVQSFMGLLSDHSRSRWGRRRPFIFLGTVFDLLFITLIGVSAGMEGSAGFCFLFAMVLMLQISLNTAHAAAQPLIPDLVPNEKRGLYSGIKALFEVPAPLILVAFTIGRMIAAGRYWTGLITAMVILVLTMIITMFVPEKPNTDPVEKIDWNPLIRLIAMTIVFTLIILGMGKVSLEITDFFANRLTEWGTLLTIGIVGLAAMLFAIGVGVWVSIQISLGEKAKSNPSYTWWVINRLAFLVGITNIASFAVFFLQGRLSLEREQAAGPASQLIMVVGIFILLLALPSGWLADRFGRKLLVILSGFCGAFGALILIIAPNLSLDIYWGHFGWRCCWDILHFQLGLRNYLGPKIRSGALFRYIEPGRCWSWCRGCLHRRTSSRLRHALSPWKTWLGVRSIIHYIRYIIAAICDHCVQNQSKPYPMKRYNYFQSKP